MGPNGSGKTTLLKIIAGEITPIKEPSNKPTGSKSSISINTGCSFLHISPFGKPFLPMEILSRSMVKKSISTAGANGSLLDRYFRYAAR